MAHLAPGRSRPIVHARGNLGGKTFACPITARPVPVATQGPTEATKTIIGRPESAKQLAQRDPCARINDSTVVEWVFFTTKQLS